MENYNDNLGCTKISIFKSKLVSNFRRKQRVLNMDINFWFPKCNKKNTINSYQSKKITKNNTYLTKLY